jgi:DNA polymerase III epsilon subunit family exonuclease
MFQANISQQQVIEYARRKFLEDPVYLDTETTGLEKNDEIVEIAVIDKIGNVLINTLIKPRSLIPDSASSIHHITNEMVKESPEFPDVWPNIQKLINNRPIGMYNAEFDVRLIKQSMEKYNKSIPQKNIAFDIMKIFSDFRGIVDPRRKAMRRFRLEEAGRYFGIPIPNSHRALDDSKLTRAVLHALIGEKY